MARILVLYYSSYGHLARMAGPEVEEIQQPGPEDDRDAEERNGERGASFLDEHAGGGVRLGHRTCLLDRRAAHGKLNSDGDHPR